MYPPEVDGGAPQRRSVLGAKRDWCQGNAVLYSARAPPSTYGLVGHARCRRRFLSTTARGCLAVNM